MEKTLRAAFYARVSSQRQADEATIVSQVAALEHRIQQDELTLEAELRFLDDGYSGSVLVRPALERLRDLAWCGGLDRLYLYAPDRLARKYVYQMLLLEEFNKHGVEVIFLNHDPQNQTPEGDLLLQMQGMIAEYERAKILERTRRGRRFAARQGKVSALAGAPYGYRYVTKQQGDGEARYDVVAEEAQVVRDIFTWVGVEGLSLHRVVARLAAANICSPKGFACWDRSTVRGLLSNPAYIGSAKYGKTRVLPRQTDFPGQRDGGSSRRAAKVQATPEEEQEPIAVPALVSESLFAAVAEQLETNRRRNRQRRRGTEYLLAGLLVCGVCNSAYCGRRQHRKSSETPYAYYRCIGGDKFRYGGERICFNKSLPGACLEESVWSDVRSLLQDEGSTRKRVPGREFERRLEGVSEETGDDLSLKKSISQLKQRMARLLDAYENGWIDKVEFESRMSRVKERLGREEKVLSEQQRALHQTEELRVLAGHFETFAEQMRDGLESADFAARRKLLQLLIDRIEVREDEVRIVYKVQLPPFVPSPASRGVLQDCVKVVATGPRHPTFDRDAGKARDDVAQAVSYTHTIDRLCNAIVAFPIKPYTQENR